MRKMPIRSSRNARTRLLGACLVVFAAVSASANATLIDKYHDPEGMSRTKTIQNFWITRIVVEGDASAIMPVTFSAQGLTCTPTSPTLRLNCAEPPATPVTVENYVTPKVTYTLTSIDNSTPDQGKQVTLRITARQLYVPETGDHAGKIAAAAGTEELTIVHVIADNDEGWKWALPRSNPLHPDYEVPPCPEMHGLTGARDEEGICQYN